MAKAAGAVGRRVTGRRFNGSLRQSEKGSSPSLSFCFSVPLTPQQLEMESRALSSESLLNLDSYLPRFHRPLYGKHIGPGKVSLEAHYLILCSPGWRRDPEGSSLRPSGKGPLGHQEAHWLSRLPTRECARKPPQYKENSLPCQTTTHSQVLLKSLTFPR